MHSFTRAASRRGVLLSGAALVLTMAACTPASPPTTTTPSIELSGKALPSSHVHGLSVGPDTSQVLLATHDGLFDVTKQPAAKIGGTNDLMGFTVGRDGVFYASGHPGAGSDLPNPLGLIKSSDGGQTWEKLSRQGQSDFHAMTATKTGIVAYDGELRHSPDGKAWNTVAAGFAPAVLAGHPDSDTILGTTTAGIQRSTDGGETWSLDKSAPVIQYAAFATPVEAAGVAPDGTTYYSADAGASWTKKGRIEAEVMAIAAVKGADGNPWVWVATPDGVVVSTDGGTTFRPMDAA
ncbi:MULTISPECIES: F510_1955 family glycosylhydrolase [unclassified Paenarthrobacter]|uniref:F510_1955 family glycosylhydrolase n=1 Tax=unclassified Paenarthrobacter TaxID=2634190 RepID=UPI0014208976|nr:exo-alpha-sialidase [Paenarthrobacter sp. MSM-2-10-13]NHW49318.1 exo-alpha-sialidase [Paenarthrobacter sp. MSM-2-10-13]